MDLRIVQKKVAWKKLSRLIGYAIFLLSLVILGRSLFDQFEAIGVKDWRLSHLGAVAALSVVYGLCMVLLAVSWAIYMVADRDWRKVQHLTAVYATTGILKYAPGNVFHFVGRNVVGRQLGVSHLALGMATMFEIGISLLATVLLAAAVFSLNPIGRSFGYWPGLVFAAAIAAIVILICLSRRMPAIQFSCFGREVHLQFPHNLLPAMMLSLTTFGGLMLIAGWQAEILLDSKADFYAVGGVFLIGWLIGFVVPGAPGGLGVREATIVLLLSPLSGEADSLVFALSMRITATLGDVVLYTLGRVFRGVRP